MTNPRQETRAKNDSVKKSVPKTKGRKELAPDGARFRFKHRYDPHLVRCNRCGQNIAYRKSTYTQPKGKNGRKKSVGVICKDTVSCRRSRKKLTDLERLLLDDKQKAFEQIEQTLACEESK